jgi:hypothetical protein
VEDGPLVVEPWSRDLADASVTAVLEPGPHGDELTVVVAISRANGLPPLAGEDLDVRVVGTDGEPWALVEPPSGPLVEVGGGLGVTANARARFRSGDAPPAELHVSLHGSHEQFRIVAKPPEPEETP